MPSSKKALPPASHSSLRQSSAALSRCASVLNWANTSSPTASSRSRRRRAHGQRLVVVVLGDEDHASGAVPGGAHPPVVVQREIGRLLDQHVLAGVERPQREVEVPARRHRDDHRLDVRVEEGGLVAPVTAKPAVAPPEGLGPVPVAAGVARQDVAATAAQAAAVHLGDEPAPQMDDPQRRRHASIIPDAGPPHDGRPPRVASRHHLDDTRSPALQNGADSGKARTARLGGSGAGLWGPRKTDAGGLGRSPIWR